MARGSGSWSLRGVSPEAREAAKQSADETGISLGAWLAQVIREVNEAEVERANASVVREKPKPSRPSSIERAMARTAVGTPATGFSTA